MNSVYLNMLLMGLIGSSEIAKQWWLTPNKAFDFACPKDADETKVKQYLEGFAYK